MALSLANPVRFVPRNARPYLTPHCRRGHGTNAQAAWSGCVRGVQAVEPGVATPLLLVVMYDEDAVGMGRFSEHDGGSDRRYARIS